MIEEQQRQIECLTNANARLNAMYVSRDSLESAAFMSPPTEQNNNNLSRKQSAPQQLLPNGILKKNETSGHNHTSLMMTPEQTPVHGSANQDRDRTSKITPIGPKQNLELKNSGLAGDRASVVIVEPVV